MNDDIKPGCVLTIEFILVKPCQKLPLYVLDSGLSKEYIDKIVAMKVEDEVVNIKFDSTANCFEAMQQITKEKWCYSYTDNGWTTYPYLNVSRIHCPCGRFVQVSVFIDFDNIRMQPFIDEFENYGLIYKAERVKDECHIRTGEIQFAIFVREGSKFLDREWLDANKDRLTVKQYFPTRYSRIPIEITHHLWNKYGYVPDNAKLTVRDEERVSIIKQVD